MNDIKAKNVHEVRRLSTSVVVLVLLTRTALYARGDYDVNLAHKSIRYYCNYVL